MSLASQFEALPLLVLDTQPEQDFAALLAPASMHRLADEVLPGYLARQRWFAGKGARIESVEFRPLGVWQARGGGWLMASCRVKSGDGSAADYFLPLAIRWGDIENPPPGHLSRSLCRLRCGSTSGLLLEAQAEDSFSHDLVHAIAGHQELALPSGTLLFTPTHRCGEWVSEARALPVRRPEQEQSNSSQVLGDKLVLKFYRKTEAGISPEWEIGRFLTDVAVFAHSAPMLGKLEWQPDEGEAVLLAVLHGYVANQGSAWDDTLKQLARLLEDWRADPVAAQDRSQESPYGAFLSRISLLGRRTGELHRALATPSDDPAFGLEPLQPDEAQGWARQVAADVDISLDRLAAAKASLPAGLQAGGDKLMGQRRRMTEAILALAPANLQAMKSRYHGDYHLGQVLVAGGDFIIIDFEGEPARPLEERRRRSSPLKDVAGMLRSFDYAAASAAGSGDDGATERLLAVWRRETKAAFLAGYQAGIGTCAVYPQDARHAEMLIRLFSLEKALYELRYELANRPQWVGIPLNGLIEIACNSSPSSP